VHGGLHEGDHVVGHTVALLSRSQRLVEPMSPRDARRDVVDLALAKQPADLGPRETAARVTEHTAEGFEGGAVESLDRHHVPFTVKRWRG
jgi:hypothetical protein